MQEQVRRNEDLHLQARRITMSDGRYMIFFTFEIPEDPDGDGFHV